MVETKPMRTAPAAIVTKYPTGVFGLDYMGSMFFRLHTTASAMIQDIKWLRIPVENIEWVEHYYDRTLDFNDPKAYKKRPMKPLIKP